jgi:hypothetical protein
VSATRKEPHNETLPGARSAVLSCHGERLGDLDGLHRVVTLASTTGPGCSPGTIGQRQQPCRSSTSVNFGMSSAKLHDLPEDPARHPDLLGVVVCPVA